MTKQFHVFCTKQHICAACDCIYRYILERNVKAWTESQAQRQAENSCDTVPCPCCGLIQPEMGAKHKRVGNSIGRAVGVIGLFVALIMGLAQGTTLHGAGYVATGVVVTCMLVFLLTALYDPNHDRVTALMNAVELVKAGRIDLVEPGNTEHLSPPPRNFGMGQMLGLMMLLVAAVAPLAPAYVNHHSPVPVNKYLKPYVLAPGEKFRVNFPDRVTMASTLWHGVAKVKVYNAADFGVPEVWPASTRQDRWGDKITTKESQVHQTVYLDSQMPDQDNLVGQPLKLEAVVNITYPKPVGTTHFEDVETVASINTTVTLADKALVKQYNQAWGIGFAVAIVNTLLASGLFFLLSYLSSRSRPLPPPDEYATPDEYYPPDSEPQT